MSPIQKEKHITKDDLGALHTAYRVSMKIKYHLQSPEGKERNQELERPPSISRRPLLFSTKSYSFSSPRTSKDKDISNTCLDNLFKQKILKTDKFKLLDHLKFFQKHENSLILSED
jgi:hypothetical protein